MPAASALYWYVVEVPPSMVFCSWTTVPSDFRIWMSWATPGGSWFLNSIVKSLPAAVESDFVS